MNDHVEKQRRKKKKGLPRFSSMQRRSEYTWMLRYDVDAKVVQP